MLVRHLEGKDACACDRGEVCYIRLLPRMHFFHLLRRMTGSDGQATHQFESRVTGGKEDNSAGVVSSIGA